MPIRVLIVTALFVCVSSRPLAAQEAETAETGGGGAQEGASPQTEGEGNDRGSTRPFRGLFGLDDSERIGASLSGSLFGAYNNNVAATLPGVPLDPRYHRSGWYTGAKSQLSVNWRGERTSANGWANAGTSYYPDFDRPLVPAYSGGIGVTRAIGQRSSLQIAQSVRYSPYFLSGFFLSVPSLGELPVPPVTSDPAQDVSGNTRLQYNTQVSISRQLSRESSITAQYMYAKTDYSTLDRWYDQHYGSVIFRRRLTRHATLRLGYGYRSVANDTGLPDVPTFHRDSQDFMIGVDYNRAIAFSMSRRTRIEFTTGTSYIGRSNISGDEFATSAGSRFHVTGGAQLVHEIARTWTATAAYRRGVGFSDLVFEPIISDSYVATLSGLLGRSDSVTVLASASRGSVGNVSTINRDYSSYVATAQWRHALARYLAAYARYAYYNHDFSRSIVLPLGFPQDLSRNGVDFGLNFWLPVR
jgi:hypothetical protein